MLNMISAVYLVPVFLMVCTSISKGQDVDYRYQKQPLPLILMHKQALSHDGQFNYAFAADNGLKQGESINPDGSRSGAYSYIDPSGQTISVKYTAGKDGFKILEGDHVPKPVPVQPASPYQHYAAPQAANSPRHALRHYDDESDKGIGSALAYIHAQDRPSRYNKGSLAPLQYRVQEDDAGSYDSRDEYNPEQDEHKGPHSFGSGYAFEFAG
ncbi:uncharacterized protein LOC142324447 [Lycorma delicatula]|uniref:uncharacterized protein LOC142324447 n=1 Tax=Lycorma delicatula TaxID=130591 RepID=UPI003F518F8B